MEPYETRQELLEAAKIHGPYIQNIHNGNYYLITRIHLIDIDNKSDFRIILDSNQYDSTSPLELFLHYIWQDGYECGKSIET
jgi:hypothetical protein